MTQKKVTLADIAESVSELDEEEMEQKYTLTKAGESAVAEAYWRAKIAEEIRQNNWPICVCERCGNIQEGAIVDRCIETALGKRKR